jgi:hypothetical protein
MKTVQQLDQDNTPIVIGDAFSEGWKLVSPNLMFYILGGLLTMVISLASSMVPFAGGLANSIILSPCLSAGAVFVTWNIANGKGWTEFGDMFKGFNFIGPLAIYALIQYGAMLVIALILMMGSTSEIMELINLTSGMDFLGNKEEVEEILRGMLNGKTIILFTIAIVAILFLSLLWVFTPHFIVIYKLQAWPAMEASRKLVTRNFFPLLGLFILLGILVMLSALPCGLGLFFTLPWMIGSTYHAFSQVTNSTTPHETPSGGYINLQDEDTPL